MATIRSCTTCSHRLSTIQAFIINMLMVYALYAICRIEYMLENWTSLGNTLSDNSLLSLATGCFLFDTSAILYTNSLYALLMLLPLHLKERDWWKTMCKYVFVVVNSAAMVLNLGDSVYFRYTGRRTTTSVFTEFENENNLASIFSQEIINHWYLFLLGIVLIFAMWKLYVVGNEKFEGSFNRKGIRLQLLRYYVTRIIALAIFVPLCIGGMRGGFTTAVRPITISNANQYVVHPNEASLILNTPFSLIRTAGKVTFKDPQYMSQEEMDALYSPLHVPSDTIQLRKKNIVILIVESFGREYIGALNEDLDEGKYKGYTPCVDRIAEKSLTFDYTFCNGRKSIDGMPSILSSIPMFIEPFFLTPSSMNDVSGIAGELGSIGYQSAFFHGAENGSMGFQAFANKTGFQKYYGRTEFNEDKRFDGDKDYDGTWAIWDEPFLQFYALKMTEMKEPFVTAVFTASSHHPFNIPEKYRGVYKDDGPNPIHRCIQYTDHAIGEFFKTASKQPWFRNTIFVITSDHTNGADHPEYQNDLGVYASPIIIYDPSGEIKAERRHCIAQQIDIMPTLLNHLGYNKPYVAFGKDLLSTKDEDTWAVNYNNGIYQFIKGDLFVQFDGNKIVGVYNFKKDRTLKHDLSKSIDTTEDCLMLEAIIQSYMQRMVGNQLMVER